MHSSTYKETYYFFIDESGDHSLQNINEDFPYFLLCGILISSSEYENLCIKIRTLKIDIFGTEDVILHSRDIRKCEGHFVKLFDLSVKETFYLRLNQILTETKLTIISNTVQKKKYIEIYGKSAINPYHISLSYIMERMIFALDGFCGGNVEIVIEKRGKNEDISLVNHYNSILDNGTYYVSSERFRQRISDCRFHPKIANDIGIQIADLCAYPLISAIRTSDYTSPAYLIIAPKIYTHPKTGQKSGLKVIP